MISDEQVAEVAKHYVIAAIWADCEEGAHPRLPKSEVPKVQAVCRRFMEQCEAAGGLFSKALERFEHGYGTHPDAGSAEAAFGHDFWLTRQGHGVGFWDRKELDVLLDGTEVGRALGRDRGDTLGDLLTVEAKKFGECHMAGAYRGWWYFYEE